MYIGDDTVENLYMHDIDSLQFAGGVRAPMVALVDLVVTLRK